MNKKYNFPDIYWALILCAIFTVLGIFYSIFFHTQYESNLLLSPSTPEEHIIMPNSLIQKPILDLYPIKHEGPYSRNPYIKSVTISSGGENYLKIIAVGNSIDKLKKINLEVVQAINEIKLKTFRNVKKAYSPVVVLKNPSWMPYIEIRRQNSFLFILTISFWSFLISFYFIKKIVEIKEMK